MTIVVNINQWQATFNKQATSTLSNASHIQQTAAQMLFDNIVRRTPVGNPSLWKPPYWPTGYVPGQLRESWKIERIGNMIEISNAQPYAERVETGWSTQAPAGMMRISILEWNSLLEKATRMWRK